MSKYKHLIINKYTITFLGFICWMLFLDNGSWLVILKLNNEIKIREEQRNYYKNELEKNTQLYNKLTNNKSEKEKFARENYFMKKNNEEIFILVADSTQSKE